MHGLPDWGLVGPKQTTYGLDDLGELAAREDSPVHWDRRGDVNLIDSFECGTRYTVAVGLGVGGDIILTCEAASHGKYALRTVAGQHETTPYAVVNWLQPSPPLSAWGFELWWGLDPQTEYLEWSIRQHYVGGYWLAAIRYDYANTRLQYRDAAGAYQNLVTGLNLHCTVDPRHMIKMVADFSSHQYVRVILDDSTYLTSASFGNVANPGDLPHQTIVFHNHVITLPDAHSDVIIDQCVVTQNEPV